MAILIRESAIRLRGIFIKVGQVMSTRIDLLPDEFTQELSILQDQIPPAPFETIEEVIVRELGHEVDQIFTHFSTTAIAAASLGQVHEAYLTSTTQKVAVKVQYPDIQQVVAMDLKLARWLITLLQHWFSHVRFDVLYHEFSRIIHNELNYIQEGHNAERFYNNFSGDERVVVPRVLWEYTTPHVLTLEFVEGIKINQFEEIRSKGIDLKALASLLAESYMHQILDHRFFHGDPHPGNLFVQGGPDGKPRLVFVDFGQMQVIPPALHIGIKRTIKAIILRDTPSIVLGLVELGFLERGHLHEELEHAVDFFMSRYRDMKPKEFKNLTIRDIAEDVRQFFKVSPLLQIPNHFILFARTAMMLNGICSKLDPDLNIIELAQPHAERFITREEGLFSELIHSGKEIGQLLLTLPRKLDDFLTMARTQGVKTHMSSQDMTGILTRIYKLGHRFTLGFLTLGLALLYSHFKQQSMATEAFVTAGATLLFSMILLWSIIKDR
jgi:predicted unusual protein kinase regulating ubiquinone biosynthesis (AarF/ABC1/UbiB family)